MRTTCPNGHRSQSEDYCYLCGAPIDPSAVLDTSNPPAPTPVAPPSPDEGSTGSAGPVGSFGSVSPTTLPPATQPCPNCGLTNTADALFCEGCGYDFTTGTMPREAAPTSQGTQ
jgi:hypothetical protein